MLRRCVVMQNQQSKSFFSYEGDEVLDMFRARNLAEKLARAINLLKKVIDQTERRVIKNENLVAA